ncbi:MAG: ATP-dependent helicase [Lachnospiraceae bacterium]|jgi:DNA helicase-2/ATP-dependent DNA helicase PcrA
MKLNSYQMRAVTHFKGPAVVIAGPGSGKTMVITERIRYLTQKKKVDPASILVVTFTRAAAEEMRQRFVYMSKDSKTRVSFGTFHSVFFTILKYAYGYSASNIAAPRQKEEILRFAMDAAGMDPLPGREDTGEILGEIEKVKGSMMDIGCYYAVSCPEETFRKIYREYTRRMRDSRLIDFEDMMADTYRLLKERPDILAAWQKRFQFILVDEFQDINLLQYRIVRMLAGYEDNLFAVGDDDQSIYGFRGANAGIMLHFTQDYPEAAVLYLPDNFRSRPEIVQAASNLISHNRHRFQKTFRPYRSASPHCVLVRQFRSPYEENAEIVRRIEQLHGNGLPYGQMAVLFRTNTQSRMLVEYLMSRNIPFRLGSRVPDLFNHWIAMDIMAYLHIAQGSRKRRDFLRIINRPNRYISRRMLQDAEIDLAALRNSYETRAWMQERISRLEYDIAMMHRMAPYAAIAYIRKAVGYDQFLQEYAASVRADAADLVSVLDELQESSRPYQTLSAWEEHIRAYERELERRSGEEDAGKDAVMIATMHYAKGLEYDVVFIPDANDGITPYRRALLEEDLEEERRMFYVAMTRAKERLYIYYVKERFGRACGRSPFIDEVSSLQKNHHNV